MNNNDPSQEEDEEELQYGIPEEGGTAATNVSRNQQLNISRHQRELLEQELYFSQQRVALNHGQQEGRPRHHTPGVFYPINSAAHSPNDFNSLRPPNSQEPRSNANEHQVNSAFSDLQISLHGCYNDSFGEAREMSLGNQQFFQNQYGFQQELFRDYSHGYHALPRTVREPSDDIGPVDVHQTYPKTPCDGNVHQTSPKTLYDGNEGANEERSLQCQSVCRESGSDLDVDPVKSHGPMSWSLDEPQHGANSMNSEATESDHEDQVKMMDLPEELPSTSGYETAPLTAGDVPALVLPERAADFQTLMKKEDNEPTQTAEGPSQLPDRHELAVVSMPVPAKDLVRQLSDVQEEPQSAVQNEEERTEDTNAESD